MTTTNIQAAIKQVQYLARNGRFMEARTMCEQLCRNNNKNPGLWALLADIDQSIGALDSAITNLQKALHIKPDYTEAHIRLGMLLHSQRKFAAAANHYRRSLKLSPRQASVQFNLGAVLQEQGLAKEAMGKYREAIRLEPDYAKAHANLGYLLRAQEKLDDAVSSYLKAARFAPEVAEIQYNLGLTYLQQLKPAEAEACLRKALQLNPEYPDAHAGMGSVYFFTGDYSRAVSRYHKALELNPNHLDALLGIATSFASQDRYEDASNAIEQALCIDPENIESRFAHSSLCLTRGQPDVALSGCKEILDKQGGHADARVLAANALEKTGNFKEAYRYLKPVLDKQNIPPNAAIVFAPINKRLGMQDDAIGILEGLAGTNQTLPDADHLRLHFALGDLYDSKGDYTKAFNNYSAGNQLKRCKFNSDEFSRNIDSLIRYFTPKRLAQNDKASFLSSHPVFIVGMPRSGTSLVEQILSSHSKVFGAGELPNIMDLSSKICGKLKPSSPYPEGLSQLTHEETDKFAKQYLDHISSLSENAVRVTDKMPSNFMHLGLINLLFPKARIIHCRRDPLDTCLSCYFQDFGPSHPYAYDLEDLGKHYREYFRLMSHWHSTLNTPILDIRYEDLIGDQEGATRSLLAFCELDWEDQCLDFHNNKRFVWTASYAQVRQPLYGKSINRWKNYERYMEPLRNALEEH